MLPLLMAEGGQQSGEKAGEEGEGQRKHEYRTAEADFVHAGKLVGKELEQQLDAEMGRDQPERAAANSDEDHRLGEEGLHDSAAAGAECGANGDFLAAR